jgi:hypothetical protein
MDERHRELDSTCSCIGLSLLKQCSGLNVLSHTCSWWYWTLDTVPSVLLPALQCFSTVRLLVDQVWGLNF